MQTHVNVEVTVTSTINVSLANGAATETVEVEAESIALNTTSPQLGSTIEPTVVKSLPVEVSGRGRQIDHLQFLAPGTTGSTFSHRISGGVDFEQEILYNGIPAPQPETEGYTTNFNPPYEMVQEFRVERSTFCCAVWTGPGRVDLPDGLRHQPLSRRPVRDQPQQLLRFRRLLQWAVVGTATPDKSSADHENNYGFTVGGPIRIPQVYNGRDRTFGHYSQEWYKQNNENTDPILSYGAAERPATSATSSTEAAGTLIPIFDPRPAAIPGNHASRRTASARFGKPAAVPARS